MTKTLKELQHEATKKGITFDRRWGVKRITSVIKKNDSMAHKKVCHAPVSVDIVEVPDDPRQWPLFNVAGIVADDDRGISLGIALVVVKVKNLSTHKYEIGNFVIKPLEVIALSESQKHDEYLMKRINRCIELKKFKLVN